MPTRTPAMSSQGCNISAYCWVLGLAQGPAQEPSKERVWLGCAGEAHLEPRHSDMGRGPPTHQVEGAHAELHASYEVPVALSLAVL